MERNTTAVPYLCHYHSNLPQTKDLLATAFDIVFHNEMAESMNELALRAFDDLAWHHLTLELVQTSQNCSAEPLADDETPKCIMAIAVWKMIKHLRQKLWAQQVEMEKQDEEF